MYAKPLETATLYGYPGMWQKPVGFGFAGSETSAIHRLESTFL